MSQAAIIKVALHHKKFDALSKQSAADLASCLIHGNEKYLFRKVFTSLVTMDLNAAFHVVIIEQLKDNLIK